MRVASDVEAGQAEGGQGSQLEQFSQDGARNRYVTAVIGCAPRAMP